MTTEIIAYEMQYNSKQIAQPNISCIPFDNKYFEQYMKIYNECFYEMRKCLDIEPYNFLSDCKQIKDKTDNMYLLIENNIILGSVACYGNEIDDLIVNKKYQNKGYGKQLLLWGIKHIRQHQSGPITLHVADWNKTAVNLYKNAGFEIVNTERIK